MILVLVTMLKRKNNLVEIIQNSEILVLQQEFDKIKLKKIHYILYPRQITPSSEFHHDSANIIHAISRESEPEQRTNTFATIF